jgi:hypothetical protein
MMGTVRATKVGQLGDPTSSGRHCQRCGRKVNKRHDDTVMCRDCESVERMMASPRQMRKVMRMDLEADDATVAA